MNILFITIAFPNRSGEKNIYSALMEEFRNLGHNVFVITALERRHGGKTAVSLEDGITITRVKTLNLQKCGFFEKTIAIFLLQYQYLIALRKFFQKEKFDLVIYSTPPITIESLVRKVKETYRSMTYLLLKDIFPQNAVDLDMMKKNGLIHKYFTRREKKLYDVSDFIGCMSQANVDYVLRKNKNVRREKIEVCPNSIRPSERESSFELIKKTRNAYNVPLNSTVFLYGGNLGLPQGIDFLVSVLEANKEKKDVFFIIVGSGTEQARLKRSVEALHMSNCSMFDFMQKSDYLDLLFASDVGLIFLSKNFTIPNFPSRILDYMDASLPVLAATDKNTDMGRIIATNQFGYWCESGDIESFNEYIDALSSDEHLRKSMGRNAKNFLINNYTTKHSCEIILKHFRHPEEAF